MELKKLPVIRHLRWIWLSISFGIWWHSIGRYLGAFPNEADLKYLDAVRRGDA